MEASWQTWATTSTHYHSRSRHLLRKQSPKLSLCSWPFGLWATTSVVSNVFCIAHYVIVKQYVGVVQTVRPVVADIFEKVLIMLPRPRTLLCRISIGSWGMESFAIRAFARDWGVILSQAMVALRASCSLTGPFGILLRKFYWRVMWHAPQVQRRVSQQSCYGRAGRWLIRWEYGGVNSIDRWSLQRTSIPDVEPKSRGLCGTAICVVKSGLQQSCRVQLPS